jgi:hypothetical protein
LQCSAALRQSVAHFSQILAHSKHLVLHVASFDLINFTHLVQAVTHSLHNFSHSAIFAFFSLEHIASTFLHAAIQVLQASIQVLFLLSFTVHILLSFSFENDAFVVAAVAIKPIANNIKITFFISSAVARFRLFLKVIFVVLFLYG